MRNFYLVVCLLLCSNLYSQKHAKLEISLRSGISSWRTFYPDDYNFASGASFPAPEGFTNTTASLSGELSFNWIKRSEAFRTRWAMGFKAGVIPVKIKWYPRSDDFYQANISSLAIEYGERFAINTHVYTGVTGGLRSSLFKIGATRSDFIGEI